MHYEMYLLLALIGLIAGTLGSLVGFGGGFIIVPLTTLLFALPSRIIAGTSTAVIVVNSITSTWVYRQQRRIDMKSGTMFAIASVPGAYLGAYFSKDLPTHTFDQLFGILLIVATILLLFKPKEARPSRLPKTTHRTITDAQGRTFEYAFHLPYGMIAAFCVGFLSSLFGIGGGTIMVPVMVLVLGFPPHIAAATSMLMVLVSSCVGTISHAVQGDIDWLYALFLAIGAWVGGQVGPRIAAKLSSKWLLRVLAALMTLTALRMVLS
jgi:uncharacterized protein